MHVVGELHLGHRLRHRLDEPLEARAALRDLARFSVELQRDALPLAHHVHGAVLGDRAVDRPLSRDDLAPPAGPPRHRDETQARVVQRPDRLVGLAREDTVGEHGVVEIEEQPDEAARVLGRQHRERSHRLSTRATMAFR